MAISDVLIELLTFSKDELHALGEALEITLPRGDKFDVAQALAQHMNLAQLREVAGESIGAGRTSLSWVALVPSAESAVSDSPEHNAAAEAAAGAEEHVTADTPLVTDPLTLDEVTHAVRGMIGDRDPFTASLRPQEVSSDPTMIKVQHDGEDLVLFTFVYSGSQRLSIRNFNFQRMPEDRFFHIVLRLSRGVLEIRAEARISGKVAKGWASEFADALGRQALRLHLSDADVEEVAEKLNAVVDKHAARHEDEDAGYGRQTVTASTKYPDVRKSPKFNADFAGSDPISSDVVFDWSDTDGNTKKVRIRISPRAGTIQCVNHVSNDVMQHVYDTLREVRAERATP